MSLLNRINGKKTYAVALVMALYAVVYLGWYQGDMDSAREIFLEAIGFAGLRNALAKR